MSAPAPIYLSSDAFSRILIVGRYPNSTYDLYIAPRLSDAAKGKAIHLDPFKSSIDKAAIDPRGCLVIINRYVTFTLMRWLERKRAELAGVLWLVDDDFNAMVFGKGVRTLNRIRPAMTLLYQKRLRRVVDHLIVSTNRLATVYEEWPTIVMPPTAECARDERPVDARKLYYFAVMHAPEHAFLMKLMQKLRVYDAGFHLTVTAKGSVAQKWARFDDVTVLPEMSYHAYVPFLNELETGGVFLVPLTPSRLNASRSDAKLVDVVRSGSAGIIARHPAYAQFQKAAGANDTAIAGSDTDEWVEALAALNGSSEDAIRNRTALQDFVSDRYERRQMIV